SKQIRGDDYTKVRAVLDASAAALKKKRDAADDEVEKRYYGAAYRDALGKSLVWRNLRDSKVSMADGSGTTVGQFVSEKIRNWEGTSFSAVMENLVKQTGTDTDALINQLSGIYTYEKLDIPEDITDKRERELLTFMNSILK
ncbi:hypothetical protein LCGC14_1619530, partial [marine sediment metagenome]